MRSGGYHSRHATGVPFYFTISKFVTTQVTCASAAFALYISRSDEYLASYVRNVLRNACRSYEMSIIVP
jgi:hypothetical protein